MGSVPLSNVKGSTHFDSREEDIPEVDDPLWESPTSPAVSLLLFLATPRTIIEVVAWGKEARLTQTMTKNVLAWLSCKDKVEFDSSSQKWKAR